MSAPTPPAPRVEQHAVSGPAEVEVHLGSGSLRVELVPDATAVEVTLSVGRGAWWQQGLSGVLAALGGAPDGPVPGAGPEADALAATEVTGSPGRDRVVVRAPRSGPARSVPLEVTVQAPSGSRLLVRTGSAAVAVVGAVGAVDVSTGSGDVAVGDVDAAADLRTGSGSVRAGHLRSGGRLRTGSGELTVDAVGGDVDLVTGSGDLRIGIAGGVLAELDVRSGSGTARSELVVDPGEPGEGPRVRVRARTGSGDVVVHGAR